MRANNLEGKGFDSLSKERGDEIRAMATKARKTPESKERHSLAMKKHHFRKKNKDTNALMDYYKDGNELDAIEKYVNDNEKMNKMLKTAKTVKEKHDIMEKLKTQKKDLVKREWGISLDI